MKVVCPFPPQTPTRRSSSDAVSSCNTFVSEVQYGKPGAAGARLPADGRDSTVGQRGGARRQPRRFSCVRKEAKPVDRTPSATGEDGGGAREDGAGAEGGEGPPTGGGAGETGGCREGAALHVSRAGAHGAARSSRFKDDLTLLLPHIGVQTLEELLRIQLPALPERLEKSPPLSDVDELKRRTVPELVELCSRAVNAARCDVSLEVVRKLKLPDDDIIEWPKQPPAASRSKDDGGQAVHGFKEDVPKPKVSDGPLRKRLYFVTKLWQYLSSADGAALAARLAADAMDSPSWTETAAWATWMLTSQCHYDDGSGAARREMVEEHLRVTREQIWFALYPAIESRHTGGGWRTYWLRVNNHVTGFFSEKAITRRSQIAAAEARARHVRKSAAEQEAAATRAADAVFRQARASTSPPTKHHHATRTPRTGSSLSTSSGYSSSSSPDLTRLAASPLKDRLRASPTFRALAVATTASQTSSSCSPTSSRIGGIGIGGGAPESPTRSRSAAPAMRRSLLTAQKEGSTVGFSSVAVEAVKRRREVQGSR